MNFLEGFLLIMVGIGITLIGWFFVRLSKGKPAVKVVAILIIMVAAIHSFIPGFEAILPGFIPEDVRWALSVALSFGMIMALMFSIVLNPRIK
ncbi:MAG: hypothetical protein HWN68_16530 [Desulfobacterales bacterium]|nr:hypothetical protein [Desulfobacterales bacterium]